MTLPSRATLALLPIFAAGGCMTVPRAPTLADARPKVIIADRNALYEFHVEWPAGLGASPALSSRLRALADEAKAQSFDGVEEDKAFRDKEGYPFQPYSYRMNWTLAGRAAKLVSLSGAFSVFTGGAHPNHGTRALLWDVAAGRETSFAALFANPAAPAAALRRSWCDALDAERDRRRGRRLEGEYGQCPPLAEIRIVPADRDGNGRFERLVLTADPYVAGPYAEGEYVVDLAVSPILVAALEPGWRGSFEVGPQPQ